MKRNKNAVKGFTLIELVVVIALLAILAALGVYTFAGVRTSAADDAAYKKLDSIEDAFLYSRTTNGYDNDKAIKNVDNLVSVEGTYTITVNDEGSHYVIVYTENGKDYIADNDLYSYAKPDDSGESGGGSGGGGGGGGGTDPDKPDIPDEPTPEEKFEADTEGLYIITDEVLDIINGEHSNLHDYLEELLKEKYKDDPTNPNASLDNKGNNSDTVYEFISKMYYDGTWPTISKDLLISMGIPAEGDWYMRPIIQNGSGMSDNQIVLYATPNEDIKDDNKSNLVFIGNLKTKTDGDKEVKYVEGKWYYSLKNEININSATKDKVIKQIENEHWKQINLNVS